MIRTISDIDFLVNNKVKSSLQLVYEKNDVLDSLSESKLEKLSVLISSIANTRGGTIVFGVQSQRNRIVGFQNCDSKIYTEQWFNFFLKQHIKPSLEDYTLDFVKVENDKTIIVLNIISTAQAPYMASDRRYYKRVDNKSVMMEEYEVRDIFNKARNSEIDMFAIMNTGGVPVMSGGKFEKITFYPRFLIKNISKVVEKDYKIEFYLPSALQNPNYDPLQQYFVRLEDEYSVFSVTGKNPIFQDELATILDAQIVVDRHSYEMFEKSDIIVKIYYSGGMKMRNYNLRKTFLYKNMIISRTDFVDMYPELDFGNQQ